MKLFYHRALMMLLFIIAFASSGNAQFKNLPFELGLNFSVLRPSTEFDESQNLKFSSYTRGFLRLGLFDKIEGEIGGGFIKLAGLNHIHKYYSTNMYPLDFRLIYSPLDFDTWKPYISAGFGIAYWTFKYATHAGTPLRVDYDGFTRIIPLTAGAEFKITQQISFDLNLGYTHTSSSGLNAYKTESNFFKNDGAFNLGAGLIFAFNQPVKEKDFDGITDSGIEKPMTDPQNSVSDGSSLKEVKGNTKYEANTSLADKNGGVKSHNTGVNASTNIPAKDSNIEKGAVLQPTVEPRKEEVFILNGILFATNSSAITAQSESILEKNLEYLLKNTDVKIQVNGHSDNRGQLSYNMKLSEKRAAAVKDWLVRKGIQEERIIIRYFGPKEPAASNNIPSGRQKNRSADFQKAD